MHFFKRDLLGMHYGLGAGVVIQYLSEWASFPCQDRVG